MREATLGAAGARGGPGAHSVRTTSTGTTSVALPMANRPPRCNVPQAIPSANSRRPVAMNARDRQDSAAVVARLRRLSPALTRRHGAPTSVASAEQNGPRDRVRRSLRRAAVTFLLIAGETVPIVRCEWWRAFRDTSQRPSTLSWKLPQPGRPRWKTPCC